MSILLETLLLYGSFAIALGGLLVHLFFPPDSLKETILGNVIVFLVLMTGVGLYQAVNHERHVEGVAKEIVTTLGSETKTFDQIIDALYHADFAVANEALDDLVNTNIVSHRILDVRDEQGSRFRVRGYHITSIDAKKAASQSQSQPPGRGGLGIVRGVSFIAICLVGLLTIIELFKEASSIARSTASRILLYVGGSLLAYELYLFVSVMLQYSYI